MRGPDVTELRIGTSGWQYDDWRGRFYPADLPKARWLEFYADAFDTVEVNNSFYRAPARSSFERWRRETPDGFRFAIKMNRYLTHVRRLRVTSEMIARGYDPLRGLGDKLAVVLAQLPPRMHFDEERLQGFLAAVARRRRRHALEPRDASWFEPEALSALRRRGVALVIGDTKRWPTQIERTADFVYLRFHGPGRLYASRYSSAQLKEWAARIREWRRRRVDVYAYFNNDTRGYALRDAARLRDLV